MSLRSFEKNNANPALTDFKDHMIDHISIAQLPGVTKSVNVDDSELKKA